MTRRQASIGALASLALVACSREASLERGTLADVTAPRVTMTPEGSGFSVRVSNDGGRRKCIALVDLRVTVNGVDAPIVHPGKAVAAAAPGQAPCVAPTAFVALAGAQDDATRPNDVVVVGDASRSFRVVYPNLLAKPRFVTPPPAVVRPGGQFVVKTQPPLLPGWTKDMKPDDAKYVVVDAAIDSYDVRQKDGRLGVEVLGPDTFSITVPATLAPSKKARFAMHAEEREEIVQALESPIPARASAKSWVEHVVVVE